MSTSITPDSSPGYFTPPLQESSSWGGKVVTKVHEVTSCVISSISSVAQSILSGCIYVGTLGDYTLDDLKDYFSKENASLEDKPSLEDEKDITKEKPEYESNLKRNPSIASSCYNRFMEIANGKSPYAKCYQGLTEVTQKRSHELDEPLIPLNNSLDSLSENGFDDR